MEVWNRKGLEKRLDGFTLQLLDSNRKPLFKSGKTKGSQRIKFDLRNKSMVYHLLFNGKPEPEATQVSMPPAEVPSDTKTNCLLFLKGDTVAILGNGLADRMQHDAWMETVLQSALKGQEVSFRNMAFSGDRPNQYPRSKGFTPMDQYLRHVKADVVFAMFGYNGSFDGAQNAENHKNLLG